MRLNLGGVRGSSVLLVPSFEFFDLPKQPGIFFESRKPQCHVTEHRPPVALPRRPLPSVPRRTRDRNPRRYGSSVAGFSLVARAAYLCMRITFNTRSQGASGLQPDMLRACPAGSSRRFPLETSAYPWERGRRQVTILNRPGLMKASCECYQLLRTRVAFHLPKTYT